MRASFLRETLVEESRAYGFTISFWGSGALLTKALGLPTLLQALGLGFGAVTGFAALLMVFRNPLREADPENSRFPVLSMVHYIAALIPVAVTFLITQKIDGATAFFLAGLNVSIFYNLGMMVEEMLAVKAESLGNQED